ALTTAVRGSRLKGSPIRLPRSEFRNPSESVLTGGRYLRATLQHRPSAVSKDRIQKDPFGFNTGYVEDLYAQYLENPQSVSESWREFFADFAPGPTFHAAAPAGDGTAALPEVRPARPAAPAGDGAAVAPEAKPPAPTPEAPPAPARPPAPQIDVPEGAATAPLRGVAAKIVENMEASLTIPTATSVREVPVKLLAENRRLINRHQQAAGGEKVSFTHLIAYAIVRALGQYPGMNATFRYTDDGKPERIDPDGTNLGLAIDVEKGGKRQLLVPNIKRAQGMSFAEFLGSYNDVVKRALGGSLEVTDFQHTTATITNPGMIGTAMSVPRLMPGQGVIVGVGAIGYPAEF